jgi:hypothetical protein
MSYDADFANTGRAAAPLDPTIMIGADPVFWAAILLIILAALCFGWWLGARSSDARADAAQAIWKAVHDAARSAMAADDNALKGRAEALRKVVEERLDKTLALSGGLSCRFRTLDDALAGRGPAHPRGGHGTAVGLGHGAVGGHGEPAPADRGGGGGGAATASITIVTSATPEQTHATGAERGAGHDSGAMRDLTQREQTDALRLAVAAFNEHWRDGSGRVRELRQARAELSDPGPARAPAGRISGTRAKH